MSSAELLAMYAPDTIAADDLGPDSLWIESHRRVLENNRILMHRWPQAGRVLVTLLGYDILANLNSAAAAHLGESGMTTFEEAIDLALEDVIDTADLEQADRIFLEELMKYDAIVAGRASLTTPSRVVFKFDILYAVEAIDYYLRSYAWSSLLRDIVPLAQPTTVEVIQTGTQRTLRLVPEAE